MSGLGKLGRKRLTSLIQRDKNIISVKRSASILGISTKHAAKILSQLTNKGWLVRVKRGIYIPVPLESTTSDISLENPWVIAENLYFPCYIGGVSAAEHWGLTEQVFRTVVVFTIQKPRDRKPIINGTHFILHTIPRAALFGLKTLWQEQTKVFISDPTRTILDFLIDPKMGGGIRPTTDMLKTYLKSKYKNLELLVDYAKKLGNSAVFKRLGFLLEKYMPHEQRIIDACKKQITISKTKLDPQLDNNKFITRWRLWIPKDWKE